MEAREAESRHAEVKKVSVPEHQYTFEEACSSPSRQQSTYRRSKRAASYFTVPRWSRTAAYWGAPISFKAKLKDRTQKYGHFLGCARDLIVTNLNNGVPMHGTLVQYFTVAALRGYTR